MCEQCLVPMRTSYSCTTVSKSGFLSLSGILRAQNKRETPPTKTLALRSKTRPERALGQNTWIGRVVSGSVDTEYPSSKTRSVTAGETSPFRIAHCWLGGQIKTVTQQCRSYPRITHAPLAALLQGTKANVTDCALPNEPSTAQELQILGEQSRKGSLKLRISYLAPSAPSTSSSRALLHGQGGPCPGDC